MSRAACIASDVRQTTRTRSVAKFTLTDATSGKRAMARSTRETHEAQVMPPIPRSLTSDVKEEACMGVSLLLCISTYEWSEGWTTPFKFKA